MFIKPTIVFINGPTRPQKLRKSIVKFASNIKKALENLI